MLATPLVTMTCPLSLVTGFHSISSGLVIVEKNGRDESDLGATTVYRATRISPLPEFSLTVQESLVTIEFVHFSFFGPNALMSTGLNFWSVIFRNEGKIPAT